MQTCPRDPGPKSGLLISDRTMKLPPAQPLWCLQPLKAPHNPIPSLCDLNCFCKSSAEIQWDTIFPLPFSHLLIASGQETEENWVKGSLLNISSNGVLRWAVRQMLGWSQGALPCHIPREHSTAGAPCSLLHEMQLRPWTGQWYKSIWVNNSDSDDTKKSVKCSQASMGSHYGLQTSLPKRHRKRDCPQPPLEVYTSFHDSARRPATHTA